MTQAAILAASGSPGTTTGFKNKIINGNMVINQRGWSGTITADSTYTLDRWVARNDLTSKMSVTQSSDAPAGFSYSLLVTSLANTTSPNYYFMSQSIEGFNAADLAWGTSSAKTVTVSFWVKSSLTGTFGGSIVNSNESRCYPFTYTISAANTWTQASVTIPGDTTGTWVGATNGVAMRVSLEVGIGSSLSSPAGAWTSTASQYGATGAVNVLASSGSTIQWTGVQLEVGTTATNFDFRSIGTELGLCYRYYYQMNGVTNQDILVGTACDQTTWLRYSFALPTTMRAAPSLVSAGGTSYANLISSGGRASTSISLDNTSATNACVNLYSAGISAGTTGTFRLQAGLYLGLSAEL